MPGLCGRPGALALAAVAFGASVSPAAAHAVAERYDLPVPLGYFVAAAAAVVALTFVAMAAFIYATPRPSAGARIALFHVHPALAWPVRLVGLALFCLVIVAGLLGDQHPARNFAPTAVWTGWWVGFSLLTGLVINLWPALNPWSTLALALEALGSRARPAPSYPPWLGEWPAVALLFAFVWIETVSPFASEPFWLALSALAYTAVTLTGMALFGRATWLRRGEVFTLVFAILGRFAPLQIDRRTVVLRPWAFGLLTDNRPSSAEVAFILLLLSAVLFDGLLGTSLWRAVEPWLPRDRNGLLAASVGLSATWALFLAAYLGACALTRIISTGAATSSIASRFALTLVPIAIGYNIAHNYSYLLIQGQEIVRLLSDPFGYGWNLFGTATWRPDIAVVDARTAWNVAIGATVGGHIVAVWLAHVMVLRSSPTRALAIRSLVPLTALMVLYTGASLAILADPITRFRTPDPGYSERVLSVVKG